jgi:hypothetical protein
MNAAFCLAAIFAADDGAILGTHCGKSAVWHYGRF